VPEGAPTDSPDTVTVYGLGERKNALFTDRLRRDGVEVFASAVALIRTLRAQGVKTGVVTSSRNGREVLRAADLEDLFDVRIDGLDAEVFGLEGKPHPDPFLKSAALLGVAPGRTVVIEDAISGVVAGRRGGFRLIVGVDLGGNRDALVAHGADVVGADLSELAVADLDAQLRRKRELVVAWRIEQEGFDLHRDTTASRDRRRSVRPVAVLGRHARRGTAARRRRRNPGGDCALLDEPVHGRRRALSPSWRRRA
jgi:HAD superfamily hydrolase (TIGR01509 family)